MTEPESMFLDAEKLLVKRKDFRRTRTPGRSELTLRMRENLVEVTGHGDFRSRLGCDEIRRLRRKSKIEIRKSYSSIA